MEFFQSILSLSMMLWTQGPATLAILRAVISCACWSLRVTAAVFNWWWNVSEFAHLLCLRFGFVVIKNLLLCGF
jgi:hypothetical protein